MSEYINIGKIVVAFGISGELVLKHALGKKIVFKTGDVIFIEEQKASYLPYFIQSSKPKDTEETNIQIEGFDTREKAQKLVRKQVWLAEQDFRKLAAKNSTIGLIDYSLVDNGKTLGKITEVIEQPHQVLLQIIIDEKEVLIPLHDETLININHKKKEVHVVLPDGLLDVYLL